MAVDTLQPWAFLKCSNLFEDDAPDERGVQLCSLGWSNSCPSLSSVSASVLQRSRAQTPLLPRSRAPTPLRQAGSRVQTPLTSAGSTRPCSQSGSLQFGSLGAESWYSSQFGRNSAQSGSQILGTVPQTNILTFKQTTLLPSVLCARRQTSPGADARVNAERNARMGQTRGEGGSSAKSAKVKRQDRALACPPLVQSSPQIVQAVPTTRRRRPVARLGMEGSDAGVKKEVSFTGLRRRAWDWHSEKEERMLRQYCPDLFDDDVPRQRRPGSSKNPFAAARLMQVVKEEAVLMMGSALDAEAKVEAVMPAEVLQPALVGEKQEHASEGPAAAATIPDIPLERAAKKRTSVLDALDARTIRLTFRMFACSAGTIARRHLQHALTILGFDEDEINDTTLRQYSFEVTGNMEGALDFEAFERFCELIDVDRVFADSKKFCDADIDGNGFLGTAEVAMLLERSGVTVIRGMVRELMEEIGATNQQVNIDEFEQLSKVIRTRGGFTQKESVRFMNLYRRYDIDGSGSIDRNEMIAIIKWLSLFSESESTKVRKEIMQLVHKTFQAGSDKDDAVLEPMFLHLMRKSRELENSEISWRFANLDLDGSGALDFAGACNLLVDIGFKMPDKDVVRTCFASCRVPSLQTEFYFEDVLLMARAFHECEGFSTADIEEFRQVFDSNDADGSGAIDAVELGSVLRWLGSPADIETTHDLMEEIDFDRSGQVDFDEFLRVMRRFREDELDRLKTLFKASDADFSGGLDLKELKYLILMLGYMPTKEESNMIQSTYSTKQASYEECVGLVQIFRDGAKEIFRTNQGFPEHELLNMKHKFNKADRRSTGRSCQSHWFALVCEFYPEAARNLKDDVDKILSLFGSTNDEIDFAAFLKLMRMVADRSDYNMHMKISSAAEENGFTPAQVMEIRKIFKLADTNMSHIISISELMDLLTRVFPIEPRTAKELVTELQESMHGDDNQLDFAQFLKMMRSMMDSEHCRKTMSASGVSAALDLVKLTDSIELSESHFPSEGDEEAPRISRRLSKLGSTTDFQIRLTAPGNTGTEQSESIPESGPVRGSTEEEDADAGIFEDPNEASSDEEDGSVSGTGGYNIRGSCMDMMERLRGM